MSAAAYYNSGGHREHNGGGYRLGGSASKHANNPSVERHYDDLREKARQCYAQHDQEGMKRYNQEASNYIFLENNAEGRVKGDEIDLHGQFVHEAEDILEIRIREMKRQQQPVLHVIVGKGNHSPGHIQKIKPAVEKLCQQEGLQYETEPNEGRMKVYLHGGGGGGYHQQPQHGGYQSHQQPQYGGGGGYPGKPQQQMSPEEKVEQDLIKKCIRSCCTVM